MWPLGHSTSQNSWQASAAAVAAQPPPICGTKLSNMAKTSVFVADLPVRRIMACHLNLQAASNKQPDVDKDDASCMP